MSEKDFDANNRDPLFEDAARLIVQNQIGSTSLIQRRMKLGYNRAGRLMDQLEAAGVVGPNQGSKAREVIIKTDSELSVYLTQLGGGHAIIFNRHGITIAIRMAYLAPVFIKFSI